MVGFIVFVVYNMDAKKIIIVEYQFVNFVKLYNINDKCSEDVLDEIKNKKLNYWSMHLNFLKN